MPLQKIDNVTDEREVKNKMKEWITSQKIDNPVALTLTMKQVVTPASKVSNGYFTIDEARASTNLNVFLKDLNKMIFKNAFVRYNKRLKVIAVLEGNQNVGERLHYHLAIERPDRFSFSEFKDMIVGCWKRTIWANEILDIQEMFSDGWLNYIAKFKSKPDYVSFFDLQNSYF